MSMNRWSKTVAALWSGSATLAAQTSGSPFRSAAVAANGYETVGVQVVWASGSTPNMSVTLQVSDDGGTTWSDSGATAVSVSGTSGNGKLEVVKYHALYAVLVTVSSGTANISANITLTP